MPDQLRNVRVILKVALFGTNSSCISLTQVGGSYQFMFTQHRYQRNWYAP